MNNILKSKTIESKPIEHINPHIEPLLSIIERLLTITEFPQNRIEGALKHYNCETLEQLNDEQSSHFISILEKELEFLNKLENSEIDENTGEVIQ